VARFVKSFRPTVPYTKKYGLQVRALMDAMMSGSPLLVDDDHVSTIITLDWKSPDAG